MKLILKGLCLGALGISAAMAGVLSTVGEGGPTVGVVGITGFATTGDEMVGIGVGVTYVDGSMDGCVWAATGVGAGGCSGAGFDVAQSGDTFVSPWMLKTTSIAIAKATFDGLPGGVVFDRTFGGLVGTPFSALGADATGTTVGDDGAATYDTFIAIGMAAAVGDIFGLVMIDFGRGIESAEWRMDTDTVGLPGGVPEPSTWAMIAGGLLAVGASRFRRA
jgi:hypothetical protein